MNIMNYFDNREDCKKFLDGFNFEYFIPYFIDWPDYNRYSVQLNEDCTKVVHCRFESVKDGLVKESFPFFDAAELMIKNKEGILERRFQSAQEGESVRRYVRKAIK
jgi:hypothetical protein